jgi:hypothetical protein
MVKHEIFEYFHVAKLSDVNSLIRLIVPPQVMLSFVHLGEGNPPPLLSSLSPFLTQFYSVE